jgi:molybdopterin molybdotransferase
MDGYAIRHEDLSTNTPFTIIEEIPAGHRPQKEITEGTCARIFTGAPMPKGADTVVIQENTNQSTAGILVQNKPLFGANVRKKGEEYQIHSHIASKGTQINVGLIGLSCALGIEKLPVYARPKVAIISTGDELVSRADQQELTLGQIWSSNNHTLSAAIQNAGGVPIDCGIARDRVSDTKRAFQEALSHNPDLIISTGGVSVGDHDRVQESLIDIGGTLHFWKVRLKPGKPLVMGDIQGTPFFGLPGNPVSALVSFWLFVYPIVRRALGAKNPFLETQNVILQEDIKKRHRRAEFVRIALEIDKRSAKRTGNQSSAWISSIAHADGLLYIPADHSGYNKGETVSIMLIPSP